MKRLTEELKRAISALAQSEAGELRPHWEKAALLSGTMVGATIPPAATRGEPLSRPEVLRAHREVAFACGDRVSEPVIDYVVGLCRRLEAGLALLSDKTPEQAGLILAPHAARLDSAGVSWRIAAVTDASPNRLTHFVRNNPQVVLIVSGDSEDPLQSLLGRGRRAHPPRDLPVPLVVLAQLPDRAA